MKKILTILTAAALLLSLAGCSAGSLDAYGLYQKAVSDISEAGGVEADCEVEVDMGIIKSQMTMKILQNGRDSDVAVYASGAEVSRSVTVGDYVYSTAGGVKTKSLREDNDIMPFEGIPKLTEADFEEASVERTDEGKAFTLELGAEQLEGLVSQLYGVADITMGGASMTLIFGEDDVISKMRVSADATLHAELSLSFGVTMEFSFINVGTAPEIHEPADAQEYRLPSPKTADD